MLSVIIMSERVMSAPRMKRLGKVSLMTFADRKKFEGVEKPLRTFSLVTFSFWLYFDSDSKACDKKNDCKDNCSYTL